MGLPFARTGLPASLASTNDVARALPHPQGVVQTRVHRAGLRLLSLERPARDVGPSLASGNLDFWRVPIIPQTDKSGALYLNCAMWPMLKPAFLLGVWSFGTC